VALHVEGVADGRGLVVAVERLADRVPVVALVVGRNDVGDFARSHTGALTPAWRTARAALRHAGAVLVDDERELVDALVARDTGRGCRSSWPRAGCPPRWPRPAGISPPAGSPPTTGWRAPSPASGPSSRMPGPGRPGRSPDRPSAS